MSQRLGKEGDRLRISEGGKPVRRRGGAGNFSRKERKGRKGGKEEGGRMAEGKRES